MLGCVAAVTRNRVSVTAQAGGDPENVHLGDRRWFLRDPTVRNCFRCHSWTLLSASRLEERELPNYPFAGIGKSTLKA